MDYWNWLFQCIRELVSLGTIKKIKKWYKEFEGFIQVIVAVFLLPAFFFVIGWWLVTLGVIACILLALHGIYVLVESDD